MKSAKGSLIAQVIISYALQIPVFMLFTSIIAGIGSDAFYEGCLIAGIVTLILGILGSIINVIICIVRAAFDHASPYKVTFICKLVMIPWFIINFFLCLLIILGSLNPFLMIAIPVLLVIMVSNTYMVMLAISVPNVIYFLRNFIKNKEELTAWKVAAIIFHFIFCLDIAGSAILLATSKKIEEERA